MQRDLFKKTRSSTLEGVSENGEEEGTPRTEEAPGPVFVMHHGAGHSGLSFSLVAHHLKKLMPNQCSVVAFDCRGHGDTHTTGDTNLSLSQLSDDLTRIIKELYPDESRDLVLVGHSMGGSVVVDVAQRKRVSHVTGVVVLDVVEGSAMDALSSMTKFLSTRPTEFSSVEQAIQWSIQSDTLRNIESAKVSVPSLIKPKEDEPETLVWKTDLSKTEPFWTGTVLVFVN
ncbi:Protein phosphatase methylesterase 1 [Apophysomyces sp. BC1021]|nr:Protein phosphatase methylesterase 1 [Apophysomyces sp. BC1021]